MERISHLEERLMIGRLEAERADQRQRLSSPVDLCLTGTVRGRTALFLGRILQRFEKSAVNLDKCLVQDLIFPVAC